MLLKKKKALAAVFCAALLLAACAVTLTGAQRPKSKKVAYITFDDGPTLNTPNIVDTLDKYGAKATFFVLEERIVMYPDYIKKILNSNHAIGLHGVSHSESIYQSPTSALEEMEKTNKALESLTGKRSCLVRVPYGSSYRLTAQQAANLEDAGYKIWDWNVDPRDSVGRIIPEQVLSNMRRGISECTSSPIILFHDRKSTARMLDDVLSYLTGEGYELIAISEKQTPVNKVKK